MTGIRNKANAKSHTHCQVAQKTNRTSQFLREVRAESNLFELCRTEQKSEKLKLVKSSVTTFIEKKEFFLDSYRKFEQELNTINNNNPNDGTKTIQFAIDFYANHGRDFYLRNKSILATKQLDELLTEIKKTIDTGNLISPDNQSEKREFGQNILSFLSELNSQTLRIN